MMNNAKVLKTIFEKLASEVYVSSTDTFQEYEFWGLRIKPKTVELENNSYVEHNVVFDKIKEEIIQGIRNAKYMIWAAVAWFTDKDIFEELLLRKNAGVNVRIITSDEPSNKHLISDSEHNFEVIKVQPKGFNRLHDKFCIIDLEFVMHGSYNLSNNARNNDETWATALDRDFVTKFADEFIKLSVRD